MSESREKKLRRIKKADYQRRLALWESREPPKWRFFARWKWKNEKPKRTW